MLASPKFRVYAAFGKPPTPDAKEFAVQVVRMDRSFYVWVGPAQRASQRMDNLSAALCRASVPAASAAAASLSAAAASSATRESFASSASSLSLRAAAPPWVCVSTTN